MTNDQSLKVFSMKEGLVLLPVTGTALALTFNVGYFWGIDINLFTVFSTTEHITFALEVLPAAIAMVCVAALFPLIFLTIDRTLARFLSRTSLNSATTIRQESWIKSHAIFKWMFILLHIGSSAWIVYDVRFLSVKVFSVGTTVTILLIFLIPLRRSRLVTIFLSVISIFLVTVFFGGLDTAAGYRADPRFPHIVHVGDRSVAAKIVRSGERGVLFFREGDGSLVLMPWTDIKSVSRAK